MADPALSFVEPIASWPIGRGTIGPIIGEYRLAIGAMAGATELPELISFVERRPFQRRLVERHDIAVLLHVELEQRPGDRMEFLADTEESAERHDRVDHLSADLLDREI